YPILVVGFENRPPDGLTWPLLVSLLSLSPALGLTIAQWRRGRRWWRTIPACLAWSVVGAGTSLTVAGSLWRAARGGGEFRRTPKFGVEGREAGWRGKSYFRPRDVWAQVELAFGVAGAVLGYAALSSSRWLLGIWELPALKAVNAALGIGVLALTYRLAGNSRRGLAAVALLALNPIFLLTSTTAVAEPLLLVGLLGTVVGVKEGRPRIAAI